jgi:thiamine-phosphate pyrophosphorylase
MASLTEQRLRLQSRWHDRPLPPLILMTDAVRLPDPGPVVRRLPRGSAVILRDYAAPDRKGWAARLATLCRARRLLLFVAGDWRLALAIGAAGLHLPEGLARHGRRTWRRAWRRGLLITQAAHTPAALARASRLGVAAAIVSPVFATRSHPDAPPLGPLRFARLVRGAAIPVYALGGIDATTARRLAGSGAIGVAAISGFVPQSTSVKISGR